MTDLFWNRCWQAAGNLLNGFNITVNSDDISNISTAAFLGEVNARIAMLSGDFSTRAYAEKCDEGIRLKLSR